MVVFAQGANRDNASRDKRMISENWSQAYIILENLLSRFSKNNWAPFCNIISSKTLHRSFLERKKIKEDFFLPKSMPNFNFAESLIRNIKGIYVND
jgi:hypothetical protein